MRPLVTGGAGFIGSHLANALLEEGDDQDPALEAGVVAIFCDLARHGGRPTVFGDGN